MRDMASHVKMREREAKLANVDLRAEICAILLFLPGLGFLAIMILTLSMFVIMGLLPEDVSVPPFRMGLGWAAVAVLDFLIPAGLFMSAGVVLRHFLLRN